MGTENLTSQDGYYLGGRSLSAVVIAGSLIMTNISTEHLVGMNGSAYKNGAPCNNMGSNFCHCPGHRCILFAPQYLRLGLTTIPELLEKDLTPDSEVT